MTTPQNLTEGKKSVDDMTREELSTKVALSGTSVENGEMQRLDDTVNKKLSRNSETFETSSNFEELVFSLLAENCYLKLQLCKSRIEQQSITLEYGLRFSQLNNHSARHPRRYLEDEMEKHGRSKRTLLRMLPRYLKDQSRMVNRLGKRKSVQSPATLKAPFTERAGACYQEPD